MLYNQMSNVIPIIIELPEVCAFAHYFFKNNYPDIKIGTFNDVSNLEKIDASIIFNYDILIYLKLALKRLLTILLIYLLIQHLSVK